MVVEGRELEVVVVQGVLLKDPYIVLYREFVVLQLAMGVLVALRDMLKVVMVQTLYLTLL